MSNKDSNKKIKIVFLGTNGWYDTDTGNTTCVFVETKDYYIIFDAGNGFYKIDRYIKDDKKPIYLFLSHFHLDHIVGLHILDKFKFGQGVKIYGQPGTKKILKKIITAPYTAPFKILPFKIEINELTKGIHKIPFSVTCKFLIHASPCFGYRIEIDGKIISYCTDTGICKNLKTLAQNADLLITECSLKPGERDKNWPHLNPGDSAKVAKEAGAKKLVLTHFDSAKYKTLDERKKSEKKARKIFKNTIAALDDMRIKI